MERVYHDVLDGSKCEGAQCTCDSEIIYTLPIKNGCSEQFFGGMHMVWDNFCLAPNSQGNQKCSIYIKIRKFNFNANYVIDNMITNS